MIGIVLLNYNNWQLTVDCIKSIQNTTQCNYRIYVVDNASKVKALDSEIKYINDNKNVSLIFNSENKGYAAGNNIGMKCAIAEGCDHILISNNDVIFSEGCIDELKNYLDKNDNVAVVGPKVTIRRFTRNKYGMQNDYEGKVFIFIKENTFEMHI